MKQASQMERKDNYCIKGGEKRATTSKRGSIPIFEVSNVMN